MQKTPQSTKSPVTSFDQSHELAFAGRAALYLEKQGLAQEAIIQCLIDEFELDRATARAVATLAA